MTVVERAPFFIGSSAGELFQWEIVKNIMLKPETKIPEKAADQKLDVAKTGALSRISGKLKTTFQKDTTEVLGLRKCNDNSFANWSLDSEIKVLGKIDGNTPAKCITMTADRQIMYLATGEGNLWQYDVNHQHEPISFGKVANSMWLMFLLLSPKEDLIYTTCCGGSLKSYSTQTRNLVHNFGLASPGGHGYWLTLAHGGNTIFVGCQNGYLTQFETKSGQVVRKYGAVQSYYIQCMDVTKDSKFLYTGAQGSKGRYPLIKWNIRTGKAIKKQGPVHSDHVIALKLSLNDKFLYTGGHTEDAALRVWNVTNQTLVMEILNVCYSVRCLYLTIDGLSLFVSEDNGSLKSFDVEKDGRLKKVREHKKICQSAIWWIQGPHS